MGCDIHQKTFIWSTLERTYIDSSLLVEDNAWPGAAYFNPIVDGRNYFMFGVLAGVRSSEHEIMSRHNGIPPFMNKTAAEWLLASYHSFVWYFLDELEEKLGEVKTALEKDLSEELERFNQEMASNKILASSIPEFDSILSCEDDEYEEKTKRFKSEKKRALEYYADHKACLDEIKWHTDSVEKSIAVIEDYTPLSFNAVESNPSRVIVMFFFDS